MVAREPGESDADNELRQRDHRHSKSRCIGSSSSSEEEEEKESQAAVSAASSELGAAGSAAPVEIAEEAPKTKKETRVSPKPSAKPKIGFYKPQQSYPGGHLQVETAMSATSPGGTRRPAITLVGLENPEIKNRPRHTRSEAWEASLKFDKVQVQIHQSGWNLIQDHRQKAQHWTRRGIVRVRVSWRGLILKASDWDPLSPASIATFEDSWGLRRNKELRWTVDWKIRLTGLEKGDKRPLKEIQFGWSRFHDIQFDFAQWQKRRQLHRQLQKPSQDQKRRQKQKPGL